MEISNQLSVMNEYGKKPIHVLKIIGWIISSIVAGLILHALFQYYTGEVDPLVHGLKEKADWRTLMIIGITYMILLSIPFVPGVELGWLLIILVGKSAVFPVYILTVLGLMVSFTIGKKFSQSKITSWLNVAALNKHFEKRMGTVSTRFNFLKNFIHHYRYLLVMILLNMPGSAIIGGGGGVSFVCGMNKGFSWRGFLLTLLVSVAPVPIMIYLGLLELTPGK